MTTLTPEERSVLTTRLAEAEQAHHSLMMGQNAKVYVDQNGERVEYAVASAERLRAYVMQLKIALGMPSGIIGPLNVWVI